MTRFSCLCCLYIVQLLRLRQCQRGGLLPCSLGIAGLLLGRINPDPCLLDDLQMHSRGAMGLTCFRLSGHKPFRLTAHSLIFISGLRQRRRCLCASHHRLASSCVDLMPCCIYHRTIVILFSDIDLLIAFLVESRIQVTIDLHQTILIVIVELLKAWMPLVVMPRIRRRCCVSLRSRFTNVHNSRLPRGWYNTRHLWGNLRRSCRGARGSRRIDDVTARQQLLMRYCNVSPWRRPPTVMVGDRHYWDLREPDAPRRSSAAKSFCWDVNATLGGVQRRARLVSDSTPQICFSVLPTVSHSRACTNDAAG